MVAAGVCLVAIVFLSLKPITTTLLRPMLLMPLLVMKDEMRDANMMIVTAVCVSRTRNFVLRGI